MVASLVTAQIQAATLQEIFELAVNNDPEIAAAEATFKSNSEVLVTGRAGLLPRISLTGTSSVGNRWILDTPLPAEPSGSHGWGASLQQPLFQLDSWYRFRQSQDQHAQFAATFADAQQTLIVRVAESYLAVLEAQAALTSAQAQRDSVQRQLEQVQQRFDVGLVAITDVLEAKAAFDDAIVAVIEQEGAQSTSFESLLRITGQPINEVSGFAAEMPIEYPEPNNIDAWIEKALQHNFYLVAAREGLKASAKDVKIAKALHYPSVTASAGWNHNVSKGRSFLGSKTNNRSYSISINVPVYQGGNIRSGAKRAAYTHDAAQSNYDFQQRTIVENTRNLFTAINTDVARVRARRRSIESSQSALDATKTGYEVGTRNIVEVLQAQQQLYQAQFQYASARYQYIRDNLSLKQLVGSLSPGDINAVTQYVEPTSVVRRVVPNTR